jgi:hypothetical protein
MIMRKILGRYVIGEGIVPFLIVFEINRDAGNLPEHDIEFQAETGIGPTYNNNEPMTDEEWRFALEEDGRMTPEEIDEYIDSFNM